MRCSQCLSENIKVLESRAHQDGRAIRRRRKCQDCDHRFTTYEREEEVQIRVEKKDGRFEDFSRDKILRSLQIACQKRPIKPAQLDRIVARIERFIQDSADRSITSRRIGDLLMEHLQGLDHVAYVRFASVYKDFADPDEFINELKNLKTTPARL